MCAWLIFLLDLIDAYIVESVLRLNGRRPSVFYCVNESTSCENYCCFLLCESKYFYVKFLRLGSLESTLSQSRA